MGQEKYVYDFDESSDGGKELLGGKGVGLAEMTGLGVPVPAGFTVTTDACRAYMANGKALPDGLERGVSQDVDLTAEDLAELVETFKRIYHDETGTDFPQDAREQLARAVRAVFDSWETPRAQVYRRAHGIPDDLGTAVNVVQMVFGNKGDDSGTGVAFTRDPATGESGLYGEFLPNAQGEDGVAGIRTPQPLERMHKVMPQAFAELLDTIRRLDEHYRDVQDIEFTVEAQRLYLLQTRSAKRTAAAAVKAAVVMVEEGLISREEAVARIDAAQL